MKIRIPVAHLLLYIHDKNINTNTHNQFLVIKKEDKGLVQLQICYNALFIKKSTSDNLCSVPMLYANSSVWGWTQKIHFQL